MIDRSHQCWETRAAIKRFFMNVHDIEAPSMQVFISEITNWNEIVEQLVGEWYWKKMKNNACGIKARV